jgi:sugar lactone lactonase YvrE
MIYTSTATRASVLLFTLFEIISFSACLNRGVPVVPTSPSPIAGLNITVSTYAVSNYGPSAIALDHKHNLFITEVNSFNVNEITPAGAVSIYAGMSTSGAVLAQRLTSSFSSLTAITADPFGNVFVGDSGGTVIKKIAADGAVTIYAGQAGVTGPKDGIGTNALFQSVTAMTCDSTGNLYISDGNAIREISPQLNVFTLYKGGILNNPGGLAIDQNRNIFIANTGGNNILELEPNGAIGVLAGTGQAGNTNGAGTLASFNKPVGIAVAANDLVYIIDSSNNLIRVIDNASNVATLAGSGAAGEVNGAGTSASFSDPTGMTFDGSGNLYVTEFNSGLVRKVVFADKY